MKDYPNVREGSPPIKDENDTRLLAQTSMPDDVLISSEKGTIKDCDENVPSSNARSMKDDPDVREGSPSIRDENCPKQGTIQDCDENAPSGNDDEETSDDEGIVEEFKERVDAIIKGFEKPHDPQQERAPRFAAYHPSFAKAAEMCEEIIADAADLLQSSEYQDSNVSDLYEQALKLGKIKYPGAKRVGLVGDSGVGKSSLINALLDQPNLASQAASGSACTCVVTEFVAPFADQITPFAAEVMLFELRQIKVILREYFQAYFKHVENVANNETDNEDLQQDADTAFEALRALFADREEFRDEDTAHGFLSMGTSDADPRIISKLDSWIDELMSRYGAQNGPIRRTADTTTEMAYLLEPFVTMGETRADCGDLPSASLWPVVRLVRVGLHSPLLQRGIIIADLPGRSDVNRLRVRTTTRYIRNCYYYILVADVARVQTDNNVQRNLQKESRAFKGRKALVCTKIDNLQASTKPKLLQPSAAALEEFNRLDRALGVTKTEFSNTEQHRRKAKGEVKANLKKHLEKLKLRRKAYEALKTESLVIMRNHKVTLAMQKQHKRLTSDALILNIHCVSSNNYELHKDGFTSDFIPLSLRVTGIPSLRYLLSKFPADDKRGVLHSFINGVLLSLIQSLQMWSQQSTLARRLEIRQAVNRPGEEAQAEIAQFLNEIELALESRVLQQFDKHQESWARNGAHLLEKIRQMSAQTVAATCRRGGAWEPKGKLRINWNESLLEPVIRDTTPAWESFKGEVKEATEQCYLKLSALVDGIREDLRKTEGVSVAHMEPFMASLGPRKVELHKSMEAFSIKLARKIRDAKLDVTQGEEDGFLMQTMAPIYDKCANFGGKGSNVARCTLLEHTISEKVPFTGMRPGVEEMMKRGLSQCQESLSESVRFVFENVLKDFDRNFVVKEVPDAKRDILREKISGFVDQANLKIAGPISREFAIADNESDRQ